MSNDVNKKPIKITSSFFMVHLLGAVGFKGLLSPSGRKCLSLCRGGCVVTYWTPSCHPERSEGSKILRVRLRTLRGFLALLETRISPGVYPELAEGVEMTRERYTRQLRKCNTVFSVFVFCLLANREKFCKT